MINYHAEKHILLLNLIETDVLKEFNSSLAAHLFKIIYMMQIIANNQTLLTPTISIVVEEVTRKHLTCSRFFVWWAWCLIYIHVNIQTTSIT